MTMMEGSLMACKRWTTLMGVLGFVVYCNRSPRAIAGELYTCVLNGNIWVLRCILENVP
jgi:hypothetical protein